MKRLAYIVHSFRSIYQHNIEGLTTVSSSQGIHLCSCYKRIVGTTKALMSHSLALSDTNLLLTTCHKKIFLNICCFHQSEPSISHLIKRGSKGNSHFVHKCWVLFRMWNIFKTIKIIHVKIMLPVSEKMFGIHVSHVLRLILLWMQLTTDT